MNASRGYQWDASMPNGPAPTRSRRPGVRLEDWAAAQPLVWFSGAKVSKNVPCNAPFIARRAAPLGTLDAHHLPR